MHKVGVVGLGWLGLPLAKNLVERGFKVKGSVRSEEKLMTCQQAGIETALFDFSNDTSFEKKDFFMDCDVAIITIPPSKLSTSAYQDIVLKACSHFNPNSHIIFTSSTSVYSDGVKEATEDSTVLSHYNYNSPLFLTEKALAKNLNQRITILRLGGLIDENRNPSRHLSGKTELPNPESPINLVHKEDVIEVINHLITQQKLGGIYNVCCDNHSSRKEFYTKQCEALKLPPPHFSDLTTIWKKVGNEKIKNHLAFQFKHNF